MNILHLHEKTQIHGGAEVYISQLQELLPQYGCATHWIGVQDAGEAFTITVAGSGFNTTLNSLPEVYGFLQQYVTDHQIDLINIHNIFHPDLVRFCLSLRPVVKSVHSPVMVCPGRDKFWRFSEEPCTIKYGLHCFYHIYKEGCSNRHPKRVKKAWNYVQFEAKEAAYRYKKIIVMSDYMRDGLLECAVPEKQIVVNPYFTPEVPEEPQQPAGGQQRLLFIGRLVSSKGPHIMIKALQQLLKDRNDLYLDIIGDGLMRDDLQAQVKSLNLEHKIIFHGWKVRSEIDTMLKNAYLVLFPSVYPEAFGIVGIEAMMRGKPVVAFDVGGVSTWLKDGENGFLVKNKDEQLFGSKTTFLLDNPAVYESMSIAARVQVISRFTPGIHINTLKQLYQNAIGKTTMQ